MVCLNMSNTARIHFVDAICIITFDPTMSVHVGDDSSVSFKSNVSLEGKDFIDQFCREFIAFLQFLLYLFYFLSFFFRKFHQEFRHEVLDGRHLDLKRDVTHVTSIYIRTNQVTSWSNHRVAFDQLQWRYWTRQIFIIIMLLLPYFPTAFAIASCYDSQTTNSQSPFSNPSIWWATRDLCCHLVSLGHNELISRYFKSWFIIIKKK